MKGFTTFFIISLALVVGCRKLEIDREPIVEADSVYNIQAKNADAIARISDIGLGIKTYGHCWSINQDPSVSDEHSNLGKTDKLLSFESQLEDLLPNTEYFIRAYAFDGHQYAYSEVQSFVTNELGVTQLKTGEIRYTDSAYIVVVGEILNFGDGVDSVLQYGHCWSNSENPDVFDSISNLGSLSFPSQFSSKISNASPFEDYYIRAYAITEADVTYGELIRLPAISIIMDSVNSIAKSAIAYSQILNIGMGVGNYGHCWGIEPNPTILNNHSEFSETKTDLSYSSQINDLLPNTPYYIRAYASYNTEYKYSQEQLFITPDLVKTIINTGEVNYDDSASITVLGEISSIGEDDASIIQYGHCWSDTENPTIQGSKTELGTRTNLGEYSSKISNLLPNKNYYIRAYAITSSGTFYGEIVSAQFQTDIEVKIIGFDSITAHEIYYKAEVISSGGFSVLEKGICISTSPNPTMDTDGIPNGKNNGEFTGGITNLERGTRYYLRAYAENSIGVYYSMEMAVKTNPERPIIQTIEVTDISPNSAVSGIIILDDGGKENYPVGIKWSLEPNDLSGVYKDINYVANGVKRYELIMTNLNESTTYYVSAYFGFMPDSETVIGDELKFTTASYSDTTEMGIQNSLDQ